MKRQLVTVFAIAAIWAPAQVLAQVRVVADVDYIAASDYADKKDRIDIYIPANVTKAPVIFSIHGGGLRQGDKSGHAFV